MNWQNKLYCGDARNMSAIPDAAVDLVICSPPYNVGTPYSQHNDTMPLPDYLALLQAVWQECYRVLKPGGRLGINIANTGRQPYTRLTDQITPTVGAAGNFLCRGEIIWNKAVSVGVSTAWGTWLSPSNPTLRDTHEYVLAYSKGQLNLPTAGLRESQLPPEDAQSAREFLRDTQSIWTFATESSRRVGHPTPFPIELPHRLIKLYTWPGPDTVVLDPFCGSGTTCVAAKQLGRSYVGYDIDPAYIALAEQRLAKEDKPALLRPVEKDGVGAGEK